MHMFATFLENISSNISQLKRCAKYDIKYIEDH